MDEKKEIMNAETSGKDEWMKRKKERKKGWKETMNGKIHEKEEMMKPRKN